MSVRARSRHELRTLLLRRGHAEEELGAAFSRLEELGYLDDQRFAASRAAMLLRDGRLGPAGVKARLIGHGLSEELCAAAVRQAQEELRFDSTQAATEFLTKRRLFGRPLDSKERARAARLLSTRGFEQELIERLLAQAVLDPEVGGD